MKKSLLLIVVLFCAFNLIAQILPNWSRFDEVQYNYVKDHNWKSIFAGLHPYTYEEKVLYRSATEDTQLVKVVTYSCVVTFQPHGIERVKTIIAINHYMDYMSSIVNGTVVFPRSHVEFIDTINDLLSDDASGGIAIGTRFRSFEPADNINAKGHQYRKDYRLKHRYARNNSYTFGYASVSYAPSIGFRSLSINTPQFSSTPGLDSRNRNERAIYAQVISVQVGGTFNRVNTFFIEGNTAVFGFNSIMAMNWKTGLDTIGIPNNNYHYRYYRSGLGIGYNYSGFKNLINPVFEAGLYCYFTKTFDRSQYDNGGTQIKIDQDLRDAGVQPNFVGFKTGIGLNVRCGYLSEVKFVPTLYYNLTAFSKGDIATRFYNVGLSVGFALRI